MKKYKFIINGIVRELSAVHIADAIKQIIAAYPDAGSLTISQVNLKQI